MERRRFLVGMGSAAVGGSALVGSGAFTRVESQRRVNIEIAEDPDAYLGLDKCPQTSDTYKPNSSFVEFEDGHLVVNMSEDNPTEDGGKGVNSDSRTWFDDVFQICNQGKQQVYYWIEAEPALETDDGYGDAVQFYFNASPDTRVDIEEESKSLPIGHCHCIGIKTVTKGLSKGDSLVEGDEIIIHAGVK